MFHIPGVICVLRKLGDFKYLLNYPHILPETVGCISMFQHRKSQSLALCPLADSILQCILPHPHPNFQKHLQTFLGKSSVHIMRIKIEAVNVPSAQILWGSFGVLNLLLFKRHINIDLTMVVLGISDPADPGHLYPYGEVSLYWGGGIQAPAPSCLPFFQVSRCHI